MLEEINIMLDEGTKEPTRAHTYDSGLDIYAPYRIVLFPRDSETFDTGVHVQIPNEYTGLILPKSGLNVNSDIVSFGVIDPGYTGPIKVKLYNLGEHRRTIEKGEKVAQLLIMPVSTPKVNVVKEFPKTERGDNGFGSTNVFK